MGGWEHEEGIKGMQGGKLCQTITSSLPLLISLYLRPRSPALTSKHAACLRLFSALGFPSRLTRPSSSQSKLFAPTQRRGFGRSNSEGHQHGAWHSPTHSHAPAFFPFCPTACVLSCGAVGLNFGL